MMLCAIIFFISKSLCPIVSELFLWLPFYNPPQFHIRWFGSFVDYSFVSESHSCLVVFLYRRLRLWKTHCEIRETFHPFLRSYHHWSYPTHWSPPPPKLLLFPYIENYSNTTQPCLRVFIIEILPNQHISPLLRVIIIEVPQQRSWEYSTIPLLTSSHHDPWISFWRCNVCGPWIRLPPCYYTNIKCF